ncbi:MAG: hypothetical protein K9N23_09155 [Akkermansiaceae bacterium]|nr:hypothetical protein [Akkermansiaceae bacterium]
MRKNRKILRTALQLALVTVGIVAGVLQFSQSRHETGLRDDFNDVALEQVLAFAERANSAYHEPETFRKEYGPEIEDGEFPGSGLRV